MRLALPLAIVVLLAGLAAGCGGGSAATETGAGGGAGTTPGATQSAPPGASSHECGGQELRVTGVGCAQAKKVLAAWQAAPSCQIQRGDSHASCEVRGYLCIASRQGQKGMVSCARPGGSILFAGRV